MKTRYGQVTYKATVMMAVNEPADKDRIYERMSDATVGLGNVEVVDFTMDDWEEEYECEAEMVIQIKEDCVMQSWDSTWGDYGGDSGGCELSSNIDENDIISVFAEHGLTVSVYLREPEFEAA